MGVPFILYLMKASRDKRNSDAAETKKREAAISEWRDAFLGIVTPLKDEIIRGEIPSDWYHRFEISLPIMRRLTTSIPAIFDSKRKAEVIAIIDRLCGMTDTEAVYGAQKVVEMLHRLEDLTNDT